MSKRFPRAKWTLPDFGLFGEKCFSIRVVDEKYNIAAFRGALFELTKAYNWQDDPLHLAKNVAEQWRLRVEAVEECADPCCCPSFVSELFYLPGESPYPTDLIGMRVGSCGSPNFISYFGMAIKSGASARLRVRFRNGGSYVGAKIVQAVFRVPSFADYSYSFDMVDCEDASHSETDVANLISKSNLICKNFSLAWESTFAFSFTLDCAEYC